MSICKGTVEILVLIHFPVIVALLLLTSEKLFIQSFCPKYSFSSYLSLFFPSSFSYYSSSSSSLLLTNPFREFSWLKSYTTRPTASLWMYNMPFNQSAFPFLFIFPLMIALNIIAGFVTHLDRFTWSSWRWLLIRRNLWMRNLGPMSKGIMNQGRILKCPFQLVVINAVGTF